MATTLIRNIKCLLQASETPDRIVKGSKMAQMPSLENAFVLIENERIKDWGDMDNCPERADQIIDATGAFVLPAWCDSHTHIVYAASREREFVDRIKGLSYEEIAENGGGILNSARRLQDTSEDELLEGAWNRLQEVQQYGTGAIEIKSGYGLSLDAEIKMLRVIKRLKSMTNMPIKSTFLGAHAIPTSYKQDRKAYIQLILDKMMPIVAEEELADYCDVFCDRGFFTEAETDLILKKGYEFGLKPKIHANELANSGGVQVGVANKAISVDHLECVGEAEIQALLASETMPTLLPSTAFFLNLEYAPARQMIDAGLGVALASDYNPGSTPSGRMPFVLSLACIKMRMLPEEAIQAATINGAYAMELTDELGTITKGKLANLIITQPISSMAFMPYAFGTNWVDKTIIKGKVV